MTDTLENDKAIMAGIKAWRKRNLFHCESVHNEKEIEMLNSLERIAQRGLKYQETVEAWIARNGSNSLKWMLKEKK